MHVINSGIRDVKFGENVKVVMPVNLYECELGDDVFIGPFVEIQIGMHHWQAEPNSVPQFHL